MKSNHKKLHELDEPVVLEEPDEFEEVDAELGFLGATGVYKLDGADESEDFEFEESEEIDEAIKARRSANIVYQNARKKRLEKLGKNEIKIRLDDETFKKLCDLCEVLGYSRPKTQMRNLIEMYSEVFKYLLRTSEDNFEYIPKTNRAIKTLKTYKYVDHLKNEKNLDRKSIISRLQEKNVKIPTRRDGDRLKVSGNSERLEKYFHKNEIVKALKLVDEKK
ncbi:TPA: hypothetical protein ACGADT_005702 [Salmonella enterica subsp. enterica serovar Newport]